MGPVEFFAFAVLGAWFVGSGKAYAILQALKSAPTSTSTGDGTSNPTGAGTPIPHGPGDNPEGGGPGQGSGAPTNPAQPQLPGPLMPHG